MQTIYEKEVLFCCPSLGRASTCSTHLVLPSVKYFVREDELEEYAKRVPRENLIAVGKDIQCPPSGKCRTLNWILDNYKTEDNIIMFTDDDIQHIKRIDFTLNKSVDTNEAELVILIQKLAWIAKQIGAKIGGFACLSSYDELQMGMSAHFKLSQKKYIDGKAFIIYEDDGTRYDEKLYLKEDIEFNCQSLLKNKRTLSAQFVCFSGKALTNKGGVVDVRTSEEEVRQGEIMLERYSGMLRIMKSTRGDGVRKKAVQFGLKL